MGWLDLTTEHEVDAIAGAFMFVRRKAGEAVNWWDEDFFFYGEDLDFCFKLKQKGWKVYYVPSVSIFHHKGVTGGIKRISESITTADYETKLKATGERFRAMEIFYDKHYKDKYPSFVTSLVKFAIKAKYQSNLKKLNTR
jgi:GT2 family glycosyltransferase